MAAQSLLIPVSEVCTRLGVGRTTVYWLTSKGLLQRIKIGRRTLFLESAVEDFIRSQIEGVPQ
jgi:excisionase family DNA binding protein